MSKQSSQLFHYVIRLNKENSAFFYFQLEANDGICFYSTLDHPDHAHYRDIDIKGDVLLKTEANHLIARCSQKFKVDILVDEIIPDKMGLFYENA